MVPEPKRALGPGPNGRKGPWAQWAHGPWAQRTPGPNGPWAQTGPGLKWALGPMGPNGPGQMGRAGPGLYYQGGVYYPSRWLLRPWVIGVHPVARASQTISDLKAIGHDCRALELTGAERSHLNQIDLTRSDQPHTDRI